MPRDRFTAAAKRRALKEKAIVYLGRYCTECGYDGLLCPPAMDFHHPEPLEKDFSISARMTSWDKIEKELDKCFLLCVRCHRETHDGLHPRYLVDIDDTRGL